MTKNSPLRFARLGFLSAIIAVMAFMFLTAGVSAQAVSPGHAASAAPAGNLHVFVVKGKLGYAFNKKDITVTKGEKVTYCDKTNVKQTIEYLNAPLYKLQARSCKVTHVKLAPGTYTFTLKSNPSAELTVIVS